MPIELLAETPSQTAGPYVHIGLALAAAGNPSRDQEVWNQMAKADAPGEHITLIGQVYDGNGHLVRDSFLELWQADHLGHYQPDRGRTPAAPSTFPGSVRPHRVAAPARVAVAIPARRAAVRCAPCLSWHRPR